MPSFMIALCFHSNVGKDFADTPIGILKKTYVVDN